MAPVIRGADSAARVALRSIETAWRRRDVVAAMISAWAHGSGDFQPTSRNRMISVGTYSVALPWARWAMSSRSAGSVGIWLVPRFAAKPRLSETLKPRTKIDAARTAEQMMAVVMTVPSRCGG